MKTGKNRHITTFTFAFVIFLLVMLTAVMIFTSVSNKFSQQYSFRTLTDSANATGSAIQTQFDGQFAVLESYSHLLSAKKNLDTDSVRRDMTAIAETGNFDSLYISLPDGSAFSQLEERSSVTEYTFFQNALIGSNAIEKVFATEEESGYIVLAVPVYKDEAVAAVLFAKLSDSAFSDLLAVSAYDGQSELFITDGGGRILMGSSSGNYTEGDIFLNTVSSARILSGSTADELAVDFENGISDTIIYEYNDSKQYAIYMPLGIEDWVIVNIASGELVEAEANTFNRNIYGLGLSALLFTVLLFLILSSQETKYARSLEREADTLRQSEQRYRIVEEFSEGVLFEGDLFTDELRFNENYQQVFGHPPFIKAVSDFGVIQPSIYIDDAPELAQFGQKMLSGDPAHATIDFRVCGMPGKLVWHRLEYRIITNSIGRPAKIIGRVKNIDAEKTRLLQLQIMAESDSLTGLCNNASFKEKVDHFLQNEGLNGEHFLMVIDLDDFKCVNDTFGHAEGDRILQLFGAKIKPLFRTSDIIGRIGGDEFAIFVKDFSRIQGISSKAEDICELVSILGGNRDAFTLTCSIGISTYSRDGSDFQELFKKADTALYQAKRIGKGRFSVYDPALNIIGGERHT